MQVYIFIYNVIYIKCDFSSIINHGDRKLVLIGSPHCLKQLSVRNRNCFDHIHEIKRDFHDVNLSEVTAIVSRYVQDHGKDNVFLLTNEESAQLTCAHVREHFDLQGEGALEIEPYVNKVVCKNKLSGHVNFPRFVQFDKQEYQAHSRHYLDALEAQLGYPMFSKPIDLVSSIEANKISSRFDLERIAERILMLQYEFEIDAFVDGELFHCDIFLINGQVKFFMTGQCSFALSRFFEGKPVGSIPVNDPVLFEQLKAFSLKALQVLNPRSGAYHMEVFKEKETGKLFFLEVGARTGGALISKVIEKIYGFNIEEINYKIKMGLIDDFTYEDQGFYAGFLNYPTMDGLVHNILEPELNIRHQFIHFFRRGDPTNQAKNLLDMSFSILFWDKSFEKVAATFEYLKNYTPVVYDDELESVLTSYQHYITRRQEIELLAY